MGYRRWAMGGKVRAFLAHSLSPITYCLLAGTGPREIVGREGVREPVVRRREGLIILTKAAASESVKDPIDVYLPLIDRSKLSDELRKRVWIFQHSGQIPLAPCLSTLPSCKVKRILTNHRRARNQPIQANSGCVCRVQRLSRPSRRCVYRVVACSVSCAKDATDAIDALG